MGRSGKYVVMATALMLLLCVVAPPLINVNRYRSDVANAIGRALDRPVRVGEVSLRIFPQPGFALSNVVIGDDTSFGHEPLLQAGDVTAALRMTSLWRGRLEIAKLTLSYPSLNLVRRSDGHWNLESLLERTAHSQAAPTGRTKPESRPRFPYIEVEGARINLKLGQEKKAFALSDADFALWQESDREWRLRLSAQPVRTDDNLSDTGTLKLSGSFGTAPSFSDMPLSLNVDWEGAQLGQFTRLLDGRDRGWRGTMSAEAVLKGTPAKLSIVATSKVDDFHRFDLYGGGIPLNARCSAELSSTSHYAHDISCHSDSGSGKISVSGSIEWPAEKPQYDFSMAADRVPAERLLAMARSMEKDWPQSWSTEGFFNASVTLRNDQNADVPVWSGDGSASGIALESKLLNSPVSLGKVSFHITDSPATAANPSGAGIPLARGLSLNFEPFKVPLGAPAPAVSRLSISPNGYQLHLQGDAQLGPLLQLSQALSLSPPETGISGSGRVDFNIAGQWNDLEIPLVTGTAQLRDVRAKLDGLPAPLSMSAGTITLTPEAATLRGAKFSLPDLPLSFSGWLQRPRHCLTKDDTDSSHGQQSSTRCRIAFQLHTQRISLGELGQLRAPAPRWYQMLGRRNRSRSDFSQIDAAGKITASVLQVRSLVASGVSADLALSSGILQMKNVRADVLEGSYHGDLRADFTGRTPQYEWRGQLQQLSMDSLAQLMHATWQGGIASFSGSGTAAGWTVPELLSSASASATVDWRQGLLSRVSLDGAASSLRVHRLSGQLELHSGALKITDAKAELPMGRYQASGTAAADGFEIQLTRLGAGRSLASSRGASAYTITGRLDDVRMAVVQPAAAPRPLTSSAEVQNPAANLPPLQGERLPASPRP